MKKIFTQLTALLLFSMTTTAQTTPLFINYSMGSPSAEAFTTNNFKAIGLGKGGVIWAGTQRGGLYRFDPKYEIWTKSEQLTNVFIHHIQMDKDSGIWIGQSGVAATSTAANVAGGVNYFPDPLDYGMVFYSQSGSTSGAYLYSRNVKSLYIDTDLRDDKRVWVVQGSSVSAGAIIRGGLSTGPNAEVPYFTKKLAGWDFGYQAAPTGEAIGGDGNEVWVGVRMNAGKSQILRYNKNAGFKGFYDHTNVPFLQNGFTPHAIYFDKKNGHKWIGLRSGGLVILTAEGKWEFMNDPALFPGGALVHPNAITEDEFGNVYIGTSAGLLEFKHSDYSPGAHPANPSSYKLYTTDDGLPGNQVTGLAYDSKKGNLLIATDAGVSFMKKKEEFIKGAVYNVYTQLSKDSRASHGLKMLPEVTATVKLFLDGVEKESINPDATGIFELKNAEDDKKYTVEVEFVSKDYYKTKFIYNDVENHTLMPATLIPDSLIRELIIFRHEMEERCFEVKLLSAIPIKTCWDGFDVTAYNSALEVFFNPAGIDEDQRKKVENLANYFATLKTVYDLGGNASELVVEMTENIFALLEAVKGLAEFGKIGNTTISNKLEDLAGDQKNLQEAQKAMYFTTVKAMKEGTMLLLKTISTTLAPFPKSQASFDAIVAVMNEGLDVILEIAENEISAGGKKAILAQILKLGAGQVGAAFYKVSYAQGTHKNLVKDAAAGSINADSDLNYSQVYQALLSTTSDSKLKFGADTLANRKASVARLNSFSKSADLVASAADAASYLALVPGFQAAAAAAKVLSYFAKGVQIAFMTFAVGIDAMGVDEEVSLSIPTLKEAGFKKEPGSVRREPSFLRLEAPVKLLAGKNNYNEKLQAFQNEAGAAAFNSLNFANRLNELRLADSAYSEETVNTLHQLMASSDTASLYIPGFTDRFRNMADSFFAKQISHKQAFYIQQMALLIDVENKAQYFAAIDSTGIELQVINDSLYNNIERLITEINDHSIGAPAYLDQTNYILNHDHVPGTNGSFTYTFTNFGQEEMKGVSFKIDQPTDGFNITSTDSIHIGNIAPGVSRQITFNFSSPATTDSFTVGKYAIQVNADNGKFRNTFGSLYIIKAGILPVTFGDFQVACSGSETVLNWVTFNESNSAYFEIEKSANGVEWQNAGKLSAAGNSSVLKQYTYRDFAGGNLFYRVKQVDMDATATYSKIVRSNCNTSTTIVSVYPIPANNILNIAIKLAAKTDVIISMMDITGREVRRSIKSLQQGENQFQMNTQGMPGGQYLLRMEGNGINKTVKVTISK